MKTRLAATLFLATGLCACASTPPGPYWEDTAWMQHFTKAVALENQPFMGGFAGLGGKQYTMGLDFHYQDGKLASIELTRSGGQDTIDRLVVKQLKSVDFPDATGPYAMEPHDIMVNYVTSEPTVDDFNTALRHSIAAQTAPSLRQRWPGDSGYVLIEFYYKDGVISDPSLLYSDAGESIGRDAMDSLLQVKPPEAIPAVAGRKLDLSIGYCFLTEPAACDEAEQRADEAVKKARYLHSHP